VERKFRVAAVRAGFPAPTCSEWPTYSTSNSSPSGESRLHCRPWVLPCSQSPSSFAIARPDSYNSPCAAQPETRYLPAKRCERISRFHAQSCAARSAITHSLLEARGPCLRIPDRVEGQAHKARSLSAAHLQRNRSLFIARAVKSSRDAGIDLLGSGVFEHRIRHGTTDPCG